MKGVPYKKNITVGFTTQEKTIGLIKEMSNTNKAECIIDATGAAIVFRPPLNSELYLNGYFYPLLWVQTYKDIQDLIDILNKRRYFLGLNIILKNKPHQKKIIDNTRFTRYTKSFGHELVDTSEGWGGAWPSGSGGYKSWIEHFSYRYVSVS